MKKEEIRKREQEKEEKWDARMNALEANWQTKIAEVQKEYLGKFFPGTKK